MSPALIALDRWVLLSQYMQPERRTAALEGLRAAHDSVMNGSRQLRPVQGMSNELRSTLRAVVAGWPRRHEVYERLQCYDALTDALSGLPLRVWRIKHLGTLELPSRLSSVTNTNTTTKLDAAAEAELSRGEAFTG